MIKTAYALLPPLLYSFYLFGQIYAFWVFMDLRNPRSDMSIVDRAKHFSNCPCSVHPVGTYSFHFPITSDRSILTYLFGKKEKTLSCCIGLLRLCLYFQVIPYLGLLSPVFHFSGH